ncbi:hypothetical protein [Oceaniradius stylonematis]|uniref:hypothetical protein n=1 Tax=Oceaniradius stylonematis TaxID=2184161 RepID=UPI003B5C21B0
MTGDGVAIRLSPHVAATLIQIAAHDGLTVSQTIDRLIAERAEAIGMPRLLDSVSRAANPPVAGGTLRREGGDGRLAFDDAVSPGEAGKRDRASAPSGRSPAGEAGAPGDDPDKNS